VGIVVSFQREHGAIAGFPIESFPNKRGLKDGAGWKWKGQQIESAGQCPSGGVENSFEKSSGDAE